MKSYKTTYLFLFLTLLAGCNIRNNKADRAMKNESDPGSLTGNISIGGAYALYPLAQIWADEFMKSHNGVRIEVTGTGTGNGINDLIGRKIDLAMISRPLSDAEQDTGIWIVPVARDGVAPVVNQKNPYLRSIINHGITPEKLIRLFTGDKQMSWGDLLDTTLNDKVAVFTRTDESGAAEVWARFLWKNAKELKGNKVTSDEEMIKSIQANPLGLGYCNFSYAFDLKTGERVKDIQVIPIDLDFDRQIDRKELPFSNITKAHRGLWLGYYPENLCRELTFASIGKPDDRIVIEFLRYVLKQGQGKVKASNFCELNNVYVRYYLEALN